MQYSSVLPTTRYLSPGDGELLGALFTLGDRLIAGPLELSGLLVSFPQVFHLQLGPSEQS